MKAKARRKAEEIDSVGDLRAEIARVDAERADAVRRLQDLNDRRGGILLDGSEQDLARHDAAIEAARRQIDQAEARYARAAQDLDVAEHRVEQDRRKALYAKGQAARANALRIMTDEYRAAAQAVVAILARATACQSDIEAANASLPDGCDPLDTAIEPFNGAQFLNGKDEMVEESYLADKITGAPAPPMIVAGPNYERRTRMVRRSPGLLPVRPHNPVADFVNLPGIGDEPYIYAACKWGRPRA